MDLRSCLSETADIRAIRCTPVVHVIVLNGSAILMEVMTMTCEERQEDWSAEFFLDRIIEKHTATPKQNPDFVDYSLRPEKKKSAKKYRKESVD